MRILLFLGMLFELLTSLAEIMEFLVILVEGLRFGIAGGIVYLLREILAQFVMGAPIPGAILGAAFVYGSMKIEVSLQEHSAIIRRLLQIFQWIGIPMMFFSGCWMIWTAIQYF